MIFLIFLLFFDFCVFCVFMIFLIFLIFVIFVIFGGRQRGNPKPIEEEKTNEPLLMAVTIQENINAPGRI